jgi:hypothetical protein
MTFYGMRAAGYENVQDFLKLRMLTPWSGAEAPTLANAVCHPS